jgi:hypothetical protein
MAFAAVRAAACTFALAALVVMLSTRFASAGDDRPGSALQAAHGIPASRDVNIDTLMDDLGSTEAIDLATKLSLNSELDSLIAAFREYHGGSSSYSLPALYARFERLLKTTLALIKDGDPTLFLKLKRSRAKLWHILIDREEFYAATDDSHVALFETSARP